MSWTTQVEAAIRALRDVHGVRITAQGDEIRELHVLTSSRRSAKQIVRDIETLMLTRFDRRVDHRVISVVQTAVLPGDGVSNGNGVDTAGRSPEPARVQTAPSRERTDDRIRFVSVNVFVNGPRAQAQVELRWRGALRLGNASGFSTRESAHRLVAQATVAAVQQFLAEDVALGVEDVHCVRLGRREVVVVVLTLIAHRHEKPLNGCCTMDQDPQQSVVLATLAALNRVVGGLRPKDTDSISRPAQD